MADPLRAPYRPITAALSAALLLFMLLIAGCEGAKLPLPQGLESVLPGEPAPSAPATPAPTDAPSPQAPDAQTTSPTTTTPSAKPATPQQQEGFDVAQMTSQLDKAKRALNLSFRGFLRQDKLGFDHRLISEVWEDIAQQPLKLQRAGQNLRELPDLDFFLLLLPLALTLCFITAFSILDRQSARWSYAWQARQHLFFLPSAVTPIWRSAIALSGQLMPLCLLILLSYFPTRAIFGDVAWSILLTNTFWLLLAIRAIKSGAEVALGLILTHVPNEHAATLQTSVTKLARFGLFVSYPVLILEAFAYHPQAQALAQFIFELGLSIYLLIVLWNKRDAILSLTPPERLGGPAYKLLRRTFSRQFRGILLLTSALLLLRAFGYTKASDFLLTRSYGIFGLTIITVWLSSLLQGIIISRVAAHENNRSQAELWQSLKGLSSTLLWLLYGKIILDLLGVYTPAILLLQAPLITVQTVQFTIYNVLSAIVIVSSAALLSKIIRLLLNARIYPSLGVNVGAAYAVNTLINYMVIVLGFFMILVALGVNLAALTVVAASLSVGIGFGLQTLTENLISGFILLFGQAVKKGDFVTVSGVYGKVEAVGARSVVVRTVDNYDLLIPSKELVNGSIINWTYRDSTVRLRIPVGVTYNADPRQVQKLLIAAANEHPHILETPAPEVWFTGFGDSAIDFQLLIFFDCNTTTPDRIKGQLYYIIWDKLKAADIEIPFPQRDLHLRSIDLPPAQLAMLNHSAQAQAKADAPSKPAPKTKSSDASTQSGADSGAW